MSTMALKLPNSFVDIDRDEMEYVDGGWSPNQVLKNAIGMTAVVGLSYVGNQIANYMRSNPGIGLGAATVKVGSLALKAFWAFPLWAKAATAFTAAAAAAAAAAVVYALGEWDLF